MAARSSLGVDDSGGRAFVVRARRGGAACATLDRLPADVARQPVAVAIPCHASLVRRLAVPVGNVRRARRALASVLDTQLPLPLSQCAYALTAVRRAGPGEVRALAVAARLEDLDRLLEQHRSAGVDPQRVEHEGLALWEQAFAESPTASDTARVVVYVGDSRISVVCGRGRELMGATGFRMQPGFLPDGLGLRLAPFLRAELGEAFDVAEWAFVGPGAEDETMRAGLLRFLPGGPERRLLRLGDPARFLARALARRAARDGEGNLRAGMREHPAVTAARAASARGGSILVLAAGLALAAGSLAWEMRRDTRDAGARAAVQAEARRISGLSSVPPGKEVLLVRRAVEERAPKLAPFRRLPRPGVYPEAALAAERAAKAGIELESLSVDASSFAAAGRAPSWEACDALAEALRRDGWKTALERGEAGADERVPFQLKGTR